MIILLDYFYFSNQKWTQILYQIFFFKDFVFHFMAFILYLIAGMWLVIHDLKYETTVIQVVGVSKLD